MSTIGKIYALSLELLYIETLHFSVRFIISDAALKFSAFIHYHQTSSSFFKNRKKQKYNATKSIFKLSH